MQLSDGRWISEKDPGYPFLAAPFQALGITRWALLFAWRDYMPTFTDASLIAAGSGALLWAVLAVEASSRRRTWAGLAGFVMLEAATFTRYTDIVVLGRAAVAVLVW